jgi:predicted ATPase/class 3 adenylate cyclase
VSGRTELPSGLVTFVFTDIEGSTRLARMLGDDYGAILGDHRAVVRAALSDFSGVEMFTEGDSFFVAFRDAAAALVACVEAQRRLSAHEWPSPDVRPRVRMGMHTGWARPVGGEYASHEVHRAARVASAAHGGQILCSAATALAVLTSGVPSVFAGMARPLVPVGGPAPAMPAMTRPGVADHLAGVDLLDLGPHRLRGFDDHEQLFQVVAAGLDRDFPHPRTPGAARHNLPAQPTSFVGRRAESAEIIDLLGRHRTVTIAGPGGSGKTRLALAVAERLLPAYGDGVWTIDAGGAATGLAPAMAAALGVRTEPGRPVLDTLLDHCAGRRMLILLQTCEIAPAACAGLVRRLLAACPGLDVLVTSRSPLGTAGEVVWRLPPLPPADVFALLTERTAAARGGQPGPANDGADLAKVAARLEGSPLAVELAAARLRLLSATQLAGRLDDPLAALDPITTEDADRHDSLATSLDWSYRTLTPRGAGLLRRLSVFAGPVDLATVEWCGSDALGALSELADKSLVEVVPGPRYRMTEQVRAYAARRLAAAGDERDARNRHVAWSLHTLDGVTVDTDGQPRTVSLTELGPYVAEWQAALRWTATGGSVRAGLRLAGALDPWWREHGGEREGRDLLFRLYQRLTGTEDEADLAHAYLVHAGLADDRDERTRFLERAERIARAGDQPALLVRAFAGHRDTLLERGRFAEAEQLCRDVITLAEQTDVPDAALPAVVTLAELLWRRDALDEAADLLGGARQVEAGRPCDRGRRTVDWLLGMVALRRRDLVAAHDHLVVALRSRLRHGFRGGAADAVAAIAVRCAQGGDQATAAVLFGGAEAARGARRSELFGQFWSAEQLSLRTSLGDAAFDAAYADGAGLGFDRIVALALAVEHPDLEDGAARFAQTLR